MVAMAFIGIYLLVNRGLKQLLSTIFEHFTPGGYVLHEVYSLKLAGTSEGR